MSSSRHFSPNAVSTHKKILFAAVTLLIVPSSLLIAGELAGRIYVWSRYGVSGKFYGIYMADPELGATHRPNSYNSNSVINNWGFRNVEDISEPKPEGITRIYCSGGSTTFCYNLPTEDAWPALLQRKLRSTKGHERDEVLNAGQICFSIGHEFALARRLVPRLRPDTVILYTGLNELSAQAVLVEQERVDLDQLLSRQQWGVFPRELDQARFLKRNSVLVRAWDYKIKSWFQPWISARYQAASPPANAIHPWTTENFERTLRSYLSFLKAHSCRVIFVRWGDSGLDNWHIDALRAFRERAVAIGREEGADVLDMVALLPSKPQRDRLFIATGVHVTNEGAEMLSSALAQMLEKRE